jgi:predicted nucleotidyltransferase
VLLGWERIRYLEGNWRRIAEEVKAEAMKHGEVLKVVVYGSVIKGKATGASDLDVAVIYRGPLTPKERRRRSLKIYLALPEPDSDLIDLKVLGEDEAEAFLSLIGQYVEV